MAFDLNSLPARPPRSRLDPVEPLVFEMLRRGWSYRAIATWLRDERSVETTPSNIHRFVRARSKRKATIAAAALANESPKRHVPPESQTEDRVFEFDAQVPLKIRCR